MKCPYCIEDINDQALVCSHCQRDLLFFRPFDDRLQSFDTRIVEITDKLSTMTALLEDLATSKVGKEVIGPPVDESKPLELTRWRLVGIVSLAVVLSSVMLLVFALLENRLVEAPYQKAVEKYYEAVKQREDEPSPLANNSSTPATKETAQAQELDRLREEQRQLQFNNAEEQFSHQQKLGYFLLIPALIGVPLAFGLWLGLRLSGIHLKYYFLLGLSSGLVEGLIWSALLLFTAGGQLGAVVLAVLGINMLRTTIGFVIGGLLGDWIERKRRPVAARRAGVAEQLAAKLIQPRREESIDSPEKRVTYDARLDRMKSTITALAPVFGLIGILAPAYLGYKQIVIKSQTESAAIKLNTQKEIQTQDDQNKADAARKQNQPANDSANQPRKSQ